MSLLILHDVTKFYGRQDVLNRVGLQIKAGERVGLIGPNGAGKTTLFKIILKPRGYAWDICLRM
ncbi:MAG: ATP-binding cassette domain-containing protein [Deltaproteobacteria bacterium]|nr:ATP-binding cassette domain-containing protein [Deltaproteobacteria bacterium]